MSHEQLLEMTVPVTLALLAMVLLLAVLGRVALSMRRRAPVRQCLYRAWDACRANEAGERPSRLARLSTEPFDKRDMRF